MHALVIEDDAITAMLIEDELREIGFKSVDTATTATMVANAVRTDNEAWLQSHFGVNCIEAAEHNALMSAFGIEMGEEALRLIDRY